MVKNITIKDEAYEYLKAQKGDLSYSDVILKRKNKEVKESMTNYGEELIPISLETKQLLDFHKFDSETYDDFLKKHLAKPTKSYLALKSFCENTSSEDLIEENVELLNEDLRKRGEANDRN